MDINELKQDKHLKIKTIGRDDSVEDDNHHAYEPTSYKVLEQLAKSGFLTSDSKILDYGCGKGQSMSSNSWMRSTASTYLIMEMQENALWYFR